MDKRFILMEDGLSESKKRWLEKRKKWIDKFERAGQNEKLDPIELFVYPTKADLKKKIICELNGFSIYKLSPFKDIEVGELFLAIPSDKLGPRENSLIRINNPIKRGLSHVEINNRGMWVIESEDFEELCPSEIYLESFDIEKVEKNRIYKYIKENLLQTDKEIVRSFQCALSSAPKSSEDDSLFLQQKSKGGIGLSYNMNKYLGLAEEINKTLKMVHPEGLVNPEGIFSDYELRGIKKKNAIFNDISYSISKRYAPKNYSSIFSGNKERLTYESNRRDNFTRGEYCILCNLGKLKEKTKSEQLKEKVELFLVTDTKSHLDIADKSFEISIIKARKEINDELKSYLAFQRTQNVFTREFDEELYKKKFLNEFEKIFKDIFKKGEHLFRIWANKAYNNSVRISKSIVRDRNSDRINSSVMNESFNVFKKSFDEEFYYSDSTTQLIGDIEKEKREINLKERRREYTKSVTRLKPVNLFEIWEGGKTLFRDIIELEEFLERLKREMCIFEPRRGYFKWIMQ